MMQLTYCQFEGLPGFKTLVLGDLVALTALVGPNGAGKSTILKVLDLALTILHMETLCDELPKHDTWQRFTRAQLRFRAPVRTKFERFGEHLGESFNEIELHIECTGSIFVLRRVHSDGRTIEFAASQNTRTRITQQEAVVAQTQNRLKDAQQNATQGNANQRAQVESQVNELTKVLERQKRDLEQSMPVKAKVSGSETPVSFSRPEVDKFWTSLLFPAPVYVPPRKSPDVAIPALISELMKLKKGRRHHFAEYSAVTARLSHLLQADVDLSDIDGRESLHIDGVPYQNASSGTETTLAFFGLTRLGKRNCLILWDEPENGLHPTRRARLLDLMFADGRQYVLATHASELAPIFSSQGKAFRCSSDYDRESLSIRLSVQHVANRRDAFSALEALGIHPARTLFTANVVIWVEGPTELIFYRHWLNARLSERKLVEGFHYTFMQYGGALISYVSAADESQFESAFDLLSLCRHPVILLDSDLRVEPAGMAPDQFLKSGATRLYKQIVDLNSKRPGAALLLWTAGREIENYLPTRAVLHAVRTLWADSAKYASELADEGFSVTQYDAYHETLAAHLIAKGVTDDNKRDLARPLAKGRSVWGSANKVEMMRAALRMPGFAEHELQWNCSEHLAQVEEFVVASCGASERI
ncbi:ATP-binding protein [Sorangium sp. So ce296]|uniref:ATP-dependent nuclease n=1 Tax=Sorangium sp. So ce296 TaxID=3133296 RepID=UPI003F5F937C